MTISVQRLEINESVDYNYSGSFEIVCTGLDRKEIDDILESNKTEYGKGIEVYSRIWGALVDRNPRIRDFFSKGYFVDVMDRETVNGLVLSGDLWTEQAKHCFPISAVEEFMGAESISSESEEQEKEEAPECPECGEPMVDPVDGDFGEQYCSVKCLNGVYA